MRPENKCSLAPCCVALRDLQIVGSVRVLPKLLCDHAGRTDEAHGKDNGRRETDGGIDETEEDWTTHKPAAAMRPKAETSNYSNKLEAITKTSIEYD